jgi:high frequency lysogenization protein
VTVSSNGERDRTLALAGIYQAAALARQLARRGYADDEPLQASIRSVLIIDAINTVSIFGGLDGVRLGLLSIARQTGSAEDLEITRYAVAMCQLARRFQRSPELTEHVSQELADIQEILSMEEDDDVSAGIYDRFADLYKETLSHLKPRIIVQGEQANLNNALIVAQIRTSLLAGVRAGVLFNQLGGSRWQLLFQRRRYIENAARLLEEIEPDRASSTLH